MNLKNKNVCVTGASGFIGTFLCEALIQNGANVTAVDTILSDNLKRVQSNSNEKLKFVKEDILKIDNMRSILVDMQIMIHLASVASPRVCNSNAEVGYQMNVDGTKKILEYSHHVSRFIFPSSQAVYGEHEEKIQKESDNTNGQDLYSLTKIMGESLCKAYNYMFKMPYTILRFGNTYGHYQASNYLIPSLILQGINEGKIEVWDPRIIRDFIFVEDTINAIIQALKNESTINQTINVGTGVGYSIKEVVEMISNQLDVPWKDLQKYQDVPISLILDNSKITQLTGWKPNYSIEQGLEKTVNYYKSISSEK